MSGVIEHASTAMENALAIALTDLWVVDPPTAAWVRGLEDAGLHLIRMAAYYEARREGRTHEVAVDYCNAVVRKTRAALGYQGTPDVHF